MTKCGPWEDGFRDNTGASGPQAAGVKVRTESDYRSTRQSSEGLGVPRVSLPGPAWTLGPEITVWGRRVGKGWPGHIQEIWREVPSAELTLARCVGRSEASSDDQASR